MIEINKKKIDLWSNIGSRATFGLATLEIEKKIKELFVITCDVSTSAGLDRFRKQIPEKFVDLGISEQNMIGVASGLSSEGFKVITTTFSPFQTLRCCEQIKVNLGYMKNKITMVGLASGLVLGSLGYTHCSIEDIGVLRSIPNITIVSPADSLEVVKALEASFKHQNSVYIRLTGGSPNPQVYLEDYKFEIGKGVLLQKGEEVVIFASGSSVSQSLKAAESLKTKGIKCSVVNMHTIKPIDEKIIISECEDKKIAISVEEHNVIGGLGSAVGEVLLKNNQKIRFIKMGIQDTYSKSGSYQNLLDFFQINAEGISKKIIENLKE